VLLEILENDKILVFFISYKIGLRFVQVFNLVYVVENIGKWKWNFNIWWYLKHCWKYVVFPLLNLILMLEKIVSSRKKPHQPIQPKPPWFGLVFKVNRTKPNCMLFYLAVRKIFNLKTEPNRTANTPTCHT